MKYKKAAVAAVCMACAGICYGMSAGSAQQAAVYEEASGEALEESGSAGYGGYETQESETAESSTEMETVPVPLYYVHICGEVVSPGVYQLEEGSRVFQAVEAAGGLTEAAAEEYLNLAGPVTDGMKIVVLSEEEAEASGLTPEAGLQAVSGTAGGDGKVNLNTAGKEELMTLNGIGESRAADIIRYREEEGPFRSIEDIKNISGIKDAAFEKIKDRISV